MKRDDFLKQDDVRGFIGLAGGRTASQALSPEDGAQPLRAGQAWTCRRRGWKRCWAVYGARAGPMRKARPAALGNWHETRASLAMLRGWLKDAIARQDEDQALAACLAILEWGGVRGAIVFLKRLHAQGRLVAYFTRLAPLMSLDSDASLDALDTDSVNASTRA